MKYRIIKTAMLLAVVLHLSSCYSTIKTDRRVAPNRHYKRAGRYW